MKFKVFGFCAIRLAASAWGDEGLLVADYLLDHRASDLAGRAISPEIFG